MVQEHKGIFIKFKSSTFSEYKYANFIPELGEICLITDKKKYVIGDGCKPAHKCKKLRKLPPVIGVKKRKNGKGFCIKGYNHLPVEL